MSLLHRKPLTATATNRSIAESGPTTESKRTTDPVAKRAGAPPLSVQQIRPSASPRRSGSPANTHAPLYTEADMNLLHHFTISTAPSLSEQPTSRLAWQDPVVRLSFHHPFLLRGILAMSAMHLASLNPDQKKGFSITAADHQNVALQSFQQACQDIGPHNCDALFAFSMLVVRYVPASAGTVINENPSESFLNNDLFSAILEWLGLIRGIDHLISHSRQWISKGPLAVFLQENTNLGQSLPADEESLFSELEKLWDPNAICHLEAHRATMEEAQCYSEALSLLRRHFSNIHPATPHRHNHDHGTYLPSTAYEHDNKQEAEFDNIRQAFFWPIRVSTDYFELLERRRPAALVLLAHYALLFKRAGRNLWWTTPPPRKIMSAVLNALPAEYHKWIAWPAEEIGVPGPGPIG